MPRRPADPTAAVLRAGRSRAVHLAALGGIGYLVVWSVTFAWIRGEHPVTIVPGTDPISLLWAGYLLAGLLVIGAIPVVLYLHVRVTLPAICLGLTVVLTTFVTYGTHEAPGKPVDLDLLVLEYWLVLASLLLIVGALEAVWWPRMLAALDRRFGWAPSRRDLAWYGVYAAVGTGVAYVIATALRGRFQRPDPLCVEDPDAYYDRDTFGAFERLQPVADPDRVRPPYRGAAPTDLYVEEVPAEPVDELPETPFDRYLTDRVGEEIITGRRPHYADERASAWAARGAALTVMEAVDQLVENWWYLDITYHHEGHEDTPQDRFDWELPTAEWPYATEVVVLTYRVTCATDEDRVTRRPAMAYEALIEATPGTVEADLRMGDEHVRAAVPVFVDWRFNRSDPLTLHR